LAAGSVLLSSLPRHGRYWYSAAYQPSKPQAHLFPHWSWAAAGEAPAAHRAECAGLCRAGADGHEVDLWVYTNGAEAELLVNGKSQGRQPVGNFSHAQWTKVPYAAGAIEARTYTKVGDATPSATDKVETTGPAHALSIVPMNMGGGDALAANGVDVAMLQVS
jgi:hypothetical protein